MRIDNGGHLCVFGIQALAACIYFHCLLHRAQSQFDHKLARFANVERQAGKMDGREPVAFYLHAVEAGQYTWDKKLSARVGSCRVFVAGLEVEQLDGHGRKMRARGIFYFAGDIRRYLPARGQEWPRKERGRGFASTSPEEK